MKLYIETLGCPKNANDSECAAGIWEKSGNEIADSPWDADVIMVNTCAFINDAKTESIDTIFDMARIIAARMEEGCSNRPALVVSGCLSQRYREELADILPEADVFVGVNDYEKLPEILMQKQKVCISEFPDRFLEFSARKLENNPYTATLRIAEGCNNCCAYCVIPQIRGRYRSRPMENIVAEAGELAEKGVKELILIAQDVTEYGRDIYGEIRLPQLLKKLCRAADEMPGDGIHWIRLMYCYEDKISDELISVMAEEERICNYIDIPLQHASDRVLKMMGRRSTLESMEDTLARLRKAMPDIHVRTTFITGFPGETEEDFETLTAFAEKSRFERMGVFPYSLEEGTPAGEMDCQIDQETKEARADSLMRMQVEISRQINEAKAGKILDVLVEGMDEEGAYIGRTMYDAPEIDNNVIFTAPDGISPEPGQMVKVKVMDAFDYDITGEMYM